MISLARAAEFRESAGRILREGGQECVAHPCGQPPGCAASPYAEGELFCRVECVSGSALGERCDQNARLLVADGAAEHANQDFSSQCIQHTTEDKS